MIVRAVAAARRLAGLGAAAVLVACGGDASPTETDGPLERDASAAFQTDSMSYGLVRTTQEYQGRVEMQYTNRRNDTVYVANCGGATAVKLERLVAGQWRTAFEPPVFNCFSQPIVIAPGTTRRFTLLIGAGVQGSAVEPRWPYADVEGTYRVVWGQFLTTYREDRSPKGDALPLDQRLSNRFRLVLSTVR
jgi:hypothetical protein